MTQKIQYLDPQNLTVHPALKNIPALSAEEMKPIRAGMAETNELMSPLLIDEKHQILDDTSRTHWLCAKARQLKEVPVQVCAPEDVHLLIIRDLARPRQLSVSAVAYLAVPHLEPAFEVAKLKKLKQIKEDSVVRSADYLKTVEDLADELGVGRTTLFDARKVVEAFKDKKKYTFNITGGAKDGGVMEMTLREFYEPKILKRFVGGEHEQNRPLGLGGVMAGIASVKAGDSGKFNPKNKNQLDLFTRATTDGITRWAYWDNLSDPDKQKYFKNIRTTIATLPPEQCEAMADYHAKLASEFRAAAKKEAA